MTKPSMSAALNSSMSAETDAFQERLARAEARFGGDATPPDVAEVGTTSELELPAEASPIPRVVREAFTIPEAEHAQIEAIRTAMLSSAVAVSKSEVIRAGLLLLTECDEAARRATFERLERVKTGRPKTV